MATKEQVKKQIDLLPEDLMDSLYELLLRMEKGKQKQFKDFKFRNFNGDFDTKNIREQAYEREKI